MLKKHLLAILCCAFALTITTAQSQQASEEQPPMTFFVTSIGMGNGADFGGLEGVDKHCQTLAEAVEVKTWSAYWSAYLSTQARDGTPAVNARDRIGEGPWHNAQGVAIASSLDSLHYDNSNINYSGALNEYGNSINSGGMGNSPKSTRYSYRVQYGWHRHLRRGRQDLQ